MSVLNGIHLPFFISLLTDTHNPTASAPLLPSSFQRQTLPMQTQRLSRQRLLARCLRFVSSEKKIFLK